LSAAAKKKRKRKAARLRQSKPQNTHPRQRLSLHSSTYNVDSSHCRTTKDVQSSVLWHANQLDSDSRCIFRCQLSTAVLMDETEISEISAKISSNQQHFVGCPSQRSPIRHLQLNEIPLAIAFAARSPCATNQTNSLKFISFISTQRIVPSPSH
jgi:hypothetical protein